MIRNLVHVEFPVSAIASMLKAGIFGVFQSPNYFLKRKEKRKYMKIGDGKST